ncbi:hypothetical protein HHK36_002700 [Tetracentron sinense]|uniref:ACB domain-containing protein n=1 Tax=Tetracentron sinense TaxID=13715 RepID=A0A835DN52_TETSI|nr:hypothetical protein HHK36_002700 [Tetracentron sinense]
MSDGENWLRCARNAWERLGNMSLEVAMEHYIALLSDSVPGWMGENPGGDSKQDYPEGVFGMQAPDLRTFIHHQPGSANEGSLCNFKYPTEPRRTEVLCEEGDATRGPNSVNMGQLQVEQPMGSIASGAIHTVGLLLERPVGFVAFGAARKSSYTMPSYSDLAVKDGKDKILGQLSDYI